MAYRNWILTSNFRGQLIACALFERSSSTSRMPRRAARCLIQLVKAQRPSNSVPIRDSKFEDVERLVKEERGVE